MNMSLENYYEQAEGTRAALSRNMLTVRLSEVFRGQVDPLRTFICHASPIVAESQSVNYETFDPVHAPGSILSFVNSPSRTFQLSDVKLISRTSAEASRNLAYINLLRSWTKPVFGQGFTSTSVDKETNKTITTQQTTQPSTGEQPFLRSNRDILGSPPKVLEFSAYSSYNQQKYGNINGVPVVITTLNITYPNDVDYIPSKDNNVPVPIIMSIDIGLTETHSPAEYSRFNINDYRSGKMVNF